MNAEPIKATYRDQMPCEDFQDMAPDAWDSSDMALAEHVIRMYHSSSMSRECDWS
jgi:hypothetical protein